MTTMVEVVDLEQKAIARGEHAYTPEEKTYLMVSILDSGWLRCEGPEEDRSVDDGKGSLYQFGRSPTIISSIGYSAQAVSIETSDSVGIQCTKASGADRGQRLPATRTTLLGASPYSPAIATARSHTTRLTSGSTSPNS